jgi:WD40 repeat protein
VPDLEPARAPIVLGETSVGELSVSPNGRDAIAFAGEVRMVDYRTGTVGGRVGSGNEVPATIGFSPDGNRMFVSLADGRTGLMETSTLAWVRAPEAPHPFGPWFKAWSRNGDLIVTSDPGTVAAWDGHTGAFIGATTAAGGSVAFTNDGTLTIADSSGSVRTWDPSPSTWVAAACRMAGRDLTEAEWRSYLPNRAYEPVCSR